MTSRVSLGLRDIPEIVPEPSDAPRVLDQVDHTSREALDPPKTHSFETSVPFPFIMNQAHEFRIQLLREVKSELTIVDGPGSVKFFLGLLIKTTVRPTRFETTRQRTGMQVRLEFM